MTLKRLLPILALAVVAAAGSALVRRSGDAPPAAEDPGDLTPFEERVLMRVDGLSGRPGAAAFLAELKDAPDLRAYLAGTLAASELRRFRELVRKHADSPGFREAVAEAGEPAPCPEAPGTDKEADLLAAPDEKCAPGEEPDLLAPHI